MKKLSPSEELAYSTVRIQCELATGKSSVGTGFFFQFSIDDGKSIPAIITNKHVIAGSIHGTFQLTRAQNDGSPTIGNFENVALDNFENLWIPHPDSNVDLCAMPTGPLLNQAHQQRLTFFYRSFGKQIIADSQLLSNLNAIEEILMIGYPVGIWDATNNLPVFRNGITATHPNIDYTGNKEFMVDCACFPGSSGSPVLLYNFGNYQDRSGNTVIGTRIALLGVLYAGPKFTVEGKINVVPIPTSLKPIPVSQIPTNLVIVIKAQQIMGLEPMLLKIAK